MRDAIVRPVTTALAGVLLGLLLDAAFGWGALMLGGRTDAAGRVGIALGAMGYDPANFA